jgi:hypothetical protein
MAQAAEMKDTEGLVQMFNVAASDVINKSL